MFYNEMKESLQKDIEVLLERHSREITKERLGDALNIIKDIDIAMGQLRRISDMEKYPICDKSKLNLDEAYKNPWYDVLKFFIETGQPQLIRLDYTSLDAEKKHRGTGKTTALLQLSNDYNIPIVFTGNDSIRITQDLKDRAKNLGLTTTVIEYKRGLRFSQDIILIDEGTRLCDLPDNKIIIGFTK